MNKFPQDFQHTLTGFGGDSSKNQAQHRAAIKKTPVILVHGNGGNASHSQWGMQVMQGFLIGAGYHECEIWAMDYLGEDNSTAILEGVHRNHINAFRDFVDDVQAYLGVEKLDFIAHSLGCGMVNAYLRGLQPDGKFNNADERFHSLSAFINLAGANYGLGPSGIDEFRTSGTFETASHQFNGVTDDTPMGPNEPDKQVSPAPPPVWKEVTTLDNGQICYVALTAKDDFVDQQKPDTGRRVGASLNKRYDLGVSILGHEKIIKSQAVFNDFKPYLNLNPPQPPVNITVEKASGNYGANLQTRVTVAPANVQVSCTAKRLTKEFQNGMIAERVVATDVSTRSSGESVTLAQDGAWELVFSAANAEAVTRTYGVNVLIPLVTISPPDKTQYKGRLEVTATASKGTTYVSLDKLHWNAASNIVIRDTSTVYFIAIDADGLPSPVVSATFEKKPVESVTATLSEHFVAQRINVSQFIELGQKFGFTGKVTLYLVNEQWVLDPDIPEASPIAPVVEASVDSGIQTSPMTVALTAHHATDAAPKIHYTLDGSEPTEHSPSLTASGIIRFDKAGTRTIKYRARDAFGHWSTTETRTYTMSIVDAQPKISADRRSGEYSEGFDTTITASDDTDSNVTVYYTENGSDPSDPRNSARNAFVDKKTFSLRRNGNHAISCYAKDSAGNERLRSFAWQIDDQKYPETSLSPSLGGTYIDGVNIKLSPSEKCEWSKYTTDGSEPTDTNGNLYTGPIAIGETTVLKFRSKDTSGNLEPVKAATFVIEPKSPQQVFVNQSGKDGYVKAKQGGADAAVGTAKHLEIGSSVDNRDSRAFLHFDTSPLPDNAIVTKAYLEVYMHSTSGDPLANQRKISIDVQQGCFGSSHAVRVDSWRATATADDVAQIAMCVAGQTQSSDFSKAGLDAINKTGATEVRLSIDPPLTEANNHVFIRGGGAAKLVVEYSSMDI